LFATPQIAVRQLKVTLRATTRGSVLDGFVVFRRLLQACSAGFGKLQTATFVVALVQLRVVTNVSEAARDVLVAGTFMEPGDGSEARLQKAGLKFEEFEEIVRDIYVDAEQGDGEGLAPGQGPLASDSISRWVTENIPCEVARSEEGTTVMVCDFGLGSASTPA
jgi:hypothetical protein